MAIVSLSLKRAVDLSYDIHIERGSLLKLTSLIPTIDKYASIGLISDTNVERLYLTDVLKNLSSLKSKVAQVVIPAGESSKTRQTKETVEDFFFEKGFGRDALFIALGGGVVGDITGFMASTYMRGVPFVQIPTTLLAQVDSSVGGKTGVDLPFGKNIIGSFFQPLKVIIDPDVLQSLPEDQYHAGLAEVIKHAIIRRSSLFDLLEAERGSVISKDLDLLSQIIKENVEIKAAVVMEDETEKNLRRILNFGHTIGHAIETLSNYSLLHGHCVALGMYVESLISVNLSYLDRSQYGRISKLLNEYGFLKQLPFKSSSEEILKLSYADKKKLGNRINYVLPQKIGQMKAINGNFGIPVHDETVIAALEESFFNKIT